MSKEITVQKAQEIALIERQELIAEAKQLINHKPSLVSLIDDNPKIKELTPKEQEEGNGTLITYLLSLLGVSTVEGDGKNLHYLAVDQYITDNLGNYTYPEIKKAFNMLLNAEFKHLKEMKGFKLFNKLDCILLAKVMECYEIQKGVILKIYNSQLKKNILLLEQKNNELSEEEKYEIVKKGIISSFDFYKKNKTFELGKHYIFDVLEKKGLLRKDAEYRKSIMEMVKTNLSTPKQEVKKVKYKGVKKAIEILKILDQRTLKTESKSISKEEIIASSKMVVVGDYFDLLIEQKTDIRNIL